MADFGPAGGAAAEVVVAEMLGGLAQVPAEGWIGPDVIELGVTSLLSPQWTRWCRAAASASVGRFVAVWQLVQQADGVRTWLSTTAADAARGPRSR